MKASETKVEDFLSRNKTQFVIPIYQRNYDWREEHCQQLLDDVIAVGKSDTQSAHFIGSIVFVSDNASLSGRINELVIIDGQQRLTTLTLIYIAIRRLAKENGDENLYNEITETFLTNKYAAENEKLKLRPTENNDAVLKILLRGDEPSLLHCFSHIAKNFQYFRSHITADNLSVIRNGLEKLMFVEISLDRQYDDPQRIFESMNSTGLDLSQADLIRNYILMGLNATEQKQLYEGFWHPIEDSCRDDETHESRVAEFIRDYLTAQNKRIPNKAKVYSEFKTAWPRANVEEWRKHLVILKTAAAHYGKLLNPKREENPAIALRLRQIKKLEITVSYPFLLHVYEDYGKGKIDAEKFADVLKLTLTFTFRRLVSDLPSHALNKIFMALYDKRDVADYVPSFQRALAAGGGLSRFPSDDEVRDKLRVKDVYGMRDHAREYLLEQLENFQNRERVTMEDNDSITIEHIFPRNPDPKWKLSLGEDNYNRLKNEFLHTLGNLTLSGNNGALGNKSFSEKRDMPEKGYRDSRLWLNRHLALLEKWDVAEHEKRASLLTNRFLQIWPYPSADVLSRITDEENESPIGEIDDATNKTPKYAVFFGQKITGSTFAEIYAKIIGQMFAIAPEKFVGTELGARLRIIRDKPEEKGYRKINDSWFVFTHYSNADKIKHLKRAYAALAVEDDLSFKF